jgi:hypothetical protein
MVISNSTKINKMNNLSHLKSPNKTGICYLSNTRAILRCKWKDGMETTVPCNDLTTLPKQTPSTGRNSARYIIPIRRGFEPGFVNYKTGALDSQPWLPWYSWNIAESGVKHNKSNQINANQFYRIRFDQTVSRTHENDIIIIKPPRCFTGIKLKLLTLMTYSPCYKQILD